MNIINLDIPLSFVSDVCTAVTFAIPKQSRKTPRAPASVSTYSPIPWNLCTNFSYNITRADSSIADSSAGAAMEDCTSMKPE